jgi:hypothetical protein
MGFKFHVFVEINASTSEYKTDDQFFIGEKPNGFAFELVSYPTILIGQHT